MNTLMKKIGIRLGVMLAVFICGVFVFSKFSNKGNENMITDMAAATLPQVAFGYQGYSLNRLSGYTNEMEVTAVRDTITPVANQTIMMQIRSYDNKIAEANLRILSLDGKEELLKQSIKSPEENVEVKVEDPVILSEERVLEVCLRPEGGKDVYYYTRVLSDENTNILANLDFAHDFHENALKKAENVGIGKAIEPSELGDNTTFQHVTIHSDYDHVTWGQLAPEVSVVESWTVKELNTTSAAIQLQYRVRCKGEENENDVYKVNEFFRVRYNRGKTLLLDYDRTMDQVVDATETVLSNKGILLGIADQNVKYLTNKKNDIVAFVQAGELWSYRKKDDTISQVFSFVSPENKDQRNYTEQYDIQLLEMEKSGNLTFAVEGYMNRGKHEGEVGVAVYYYDVAHGTVEEKAFISTVKAYGYAVLEFGKSVYYSTDRDILYALVDGTLYELDIKKEYMSKLAEGLKKDMYVVSDDKSQIAYKEMKDSKETGDIIVFDMKSGEKRMVMHKDSEALVPLGFMQKDFVYGVGNEDSKGQLATGRDVQAMYKVEIQNSKEKVVKTYEEKGKYVLGASFDGNMVTLSLAVKAAGIFDAISEDYITSNVAEKESTIELTTYASTLKETQVRITFKEGIENQEVTMAMPKYLLSEKPFTYAFNDEHDANRYYVYGYGKLRGIIDTAGEAIGLADTYGGVVVSAKQSYVWERGNRDLAYQITEKDDEIGAIQARMAAGEAPLDILKDLHEGSIVDLTGCTPEELMYIINHNRPVIAMKNTTDAIILVGYTESTITYIDTTTNEKKKIRLEELEQITTGSNHTYIA